MPQNSFMNDLGRSARGLARAFIGQGVGLGWGDEAEAWLRSQLSDEDYLTILELIRRQNDQYYDMNPVIANIAELVGSAIPFAAIPAASVPRVAAMAALEGGIYGSGSAKEDKILEGAIGAALGGGLGAGIAKAGPHVMRGGQGALSRLRRMLSGE